MNSKENILVTAGLNGDIDALNKIIEYKDKQGLDLLIVGNVLGNRGNSIDILERLLYRWDVDVTLGNLDELFLSFISKEYNWEELRKYILSLDKGVDVDELTVQDVKDMYYGNVERGLLDDWIDGYLVLGDYTILNEFSSLLGYKFLSPYNLKLKDIPLIVEDILESAETDSAISYFENISNYEEYGGLIGVTTGLDLSLGTNWKESSAYWLRWCNEDYQYDLRNDTGKTIVSTCNSRLMGTDTNTIVNLGKDKYIIDNSDKDRDIVGGVFNKETGILLGVVVIQRGER